MCEYWPGEPKICPTFRLLFLLLAFNNFPWYVDGGSASKTHGSFTCWMLKKNNYCFIFVKMTRLSHVSRKYNRYLFIFEYGQKGLLLCSSFVEKLKTNILWKLEANPAKEFRVTLVQKCVYVDLNLLMQHNEHADIFKGKVHLIIKIESLSAHSSTNGKSVKCLSW